MAKKHLIILPKPIKTTRKYHFVQSNRYQGFWVKRHPYKGFLFRLFEVIHLHYDHHGPHRKKWEIASKRIRMKKYHMEYLF